MQEVLTLQHVTHDYGAVRALSDVSLSLPVGPIGLVGQNGAGKSTLLQLLLGLIIPTQGQVRVLDWNVRKAGIELRGRIGYMPERAAFIPGMTGIEFVSLAGCLCGMPRRQAMRRAHETLSYLGLDEARYRRLEQYSVGMKQRLKLAAALVHDPDLLLLDEPAAGLDPDGRSAMLAVLQTLAGRSGKSLILSSHLLGDIQRVCQCAVILHQGCVVHVGRIQDLRFCQPRCYRLHWEGDGRAFLRELRQAGATTEERESQNMARVVVPENWITQRFFAAAVRHEVQLTGLAPEEETLESVYRRLIQKVPAVTGDNK